MLQPDLTNLRNLIEQYEALQALHKAGEGGSQVPRRMEDVAYTLCVTTGTRDVASAVRAGRHLLTEGRPLLDQRS